MSTVTVLGAEHDPRCLVARYQQAAETGGDFFPWCTCPEEVRERR